MAESGRLGRPGWGSHPSTQRWLNIYLPGIFQWMQLAMCNLIPHSLCLSSVQPLNVCAMCDTSEIPTIVRIIQSLQQYQFTVRMICVFFFGIILSFHHNWLYHLSDWIVKWVRTVLIILSDWMNTSYTLVLLTSLQEVRLFLFSLSPSSLALERWELLVKNYQSSPRDSHHQSITVEGLHMLPT